MQNKYYDSDFINKLIKLKETNPFFAISQCENYLKKYPEDYCAYRFYASLLIDVHRYEEAEEILIWLESKSEQDNNYSKIDFGEKKYLLNNSILYSKLRLLLLTEKYEEAYNFIKENKNALKNNIKGTNAFSVFCRKKLGTINHARNYYDSYIFRQIIEYKEEDFLKHIEKHIYGYGIEDPRGMLYSELPINDIIEEIKILIPNKNCLSAGFIDNRYIFRYDSCGINEGEETNYFEVVAFNKTDEIITMYPIGFIKFPYIDLNYLKIKDVDPPSRVRRLSQIEKFNQKYNKK